MNYVVMISLVTEEAFESLESTKGIYVAFKVDEHDATPELIEEMIKRCGFTISHAVKRGRLKELE